MGFEIVCNKTALIIGSYQGLNLILRVGVGLWYSTPFSTIHAMMYFRYIVEVLTINIYQNVSHKQIYPNNKQPRGNPGV